MSSKNYELCDRIGTKLVHVEVTSKYTSVTTNVLFMAYPGIRIIYFVIVLLYAVAHVFVKARG